VLLESTAEDVEELLVVVQCSQKTVIIACVLSVSVVKRLSSQRGHLTSDRGQYSIASTHIPLLNARCVYVSINAAINHSQHLVTCTLTQCNTHSQ